MCVQTIHYHAGCDHINSLTTTVCVDYITNGKCFHTPTSPPNSPPLVPGLCVRCDSSPVFKDQSQPIKHVRRPPWDFKQSGLWKRRRLGETLDTYEIVVMPELKKRNTPINEYEGSKKAKAHKKNEQVSDVALLPKTRAGSVLCPVQ